MRKALFMALMGGLWAGCSDTLPSGGSDVPIDGFQASLVGTACQALFRCPAAGESALVRELLRDPTNCTARLSGVGGATRDVADLLAAVRAGTVRYDGAAARRCFDRMSATCVGLDTSLAEMCREVFTGTVAAGGRCHRQEECAGDAWCDHGSGAVRECPGTCRPRVALGARCNGDRECTTATASGLSRCAFSGAMEPVCVEVREGAPAAEGQPCGDIPLGGNAESRVACASGLLCRSDAGAETRTCRAPVAPGGACSSDNACAAGTTCVPSAPGGARTCQRVVVRHAAGETCDARGMTGACNPLERLACTDGRCALVSDGALGSACLGGGDFSEFYCNAGLYCDSATRRCATQKATGQACGSDRECASGECEGEPRVCLARACN